MRDRFKGWAAMRATFAFLIFALAAAQAVEHSGTVRAADQFVPGATVTARYGVVKITTYTDENGRYTFDLLPGIWTVRVEMFGFAPVEEQITLEDRPVVKHWTLDMPKFGEEPAAAEVAKPKPAEAAKKEAEPPKPAAAAKPPAAPNADNRKRRGPAPAPPKPTFQNAQVQATEEGEQALAEAARQGADAVPRGGVEDTEGAFLVTGSTSGGLGAAADEEERRQRMMEGGPRDRSGMPPGMFGEGFGVPGMRGDSDSFNVGLGGLGASAIQAGFGDAAAGTGPSLGGPGGPGGRGSFGGGSMGGRGGGPGGMSGPPGRGPMSKKGGLSSRGRSSGAYSSFGNRRRTGPQYMGSLFANLNNSALDAAPYSLNGRAVEKPSYARTTFGFNAGGPIKIPKLLPLPLSSFFFTYQGTRSRYPFSRFSSLPTMAERAGDFSQARANVPVTIYDPLSRLPFAGNQVPASRFDPAAAGLLRFFPEPTYTGLVQNYRIVTSTPNTSDNYGVRIGLPLSRKDRISSNMQWQRRHSVQPQLYGFRDTGSGSGMSASLSWSHSFAPRFHNNVSVSLSRNTNLMEPYFAYRENVAAQLGITGTSQEPVNYGPPNLSFTNFGALTDGSASNIRNQTFSVSNNLTYVIRRRHNMTFGFTLRKLQNNSLVYQNARGSFSFSGLMTSGLDARGQPLPRTGFDFADFLLGLPQSTSVRYGADNNYFRGKSLIGYAQDDFRITRRLSLNFGLRYEYFAPYTELRGHLANLDLNPERTKVAVVTPGVPGPFSGELPDSLIRPDRNNLSPRFGFASRIGKRRGTVIRGGYSIFYSGTSYSQIASQMASQPPFARTISISTSSAYPLTLRNGFPVIPTQKITNTYGIDPNYSLAYAQTWNLAVQHPLPHALLVEVDYIGTKGTNLGVLIQPNRAVAGTLLTAQERLRIPDASGFNYQTAGANSSYNAGQVRLTRRMSRGISATALYTYSKGIDNASSFTGTGGTVVQFIEDLRLERGLSSFDQRHRLQAGYMLASPVGVRGFWRNAGWKTAAFSRWALMGSFSMSSGNPYTARVAGNLSNTGGTGAFGTGRAQATGLPVRAGDSKYFNLAAFTTPPVGQYGNAGRNTIPGLFRMSLNASLNRSFRIGPPGDNRRQLHLRLNATNALNHVDIVGIGTTVNSSTYGLPTAASQTRTVMLTLRMSF